MLQYGLVIRIVSKVFSGRVTLAPCFLTINVSRCKLINSVSETSRTFLDITNKKPEHINTLADAAAVLAAPYFSTTIIV